MITASVMSDVSQSNPTSRRIAGFRKQFGEGHFYLACHAALPLALTPDLLYCLWANFQRDIHGRLLDIPWIAVGDLLLSGLCETVGYELYEMDVAIQKELMLHLQHDPRFGQERIRELADFVMDHVTQQLESPDLDTRDFAQAQNWRAGAYKNPEKTAHSIASVLTHLSLADSTEWTRMFALLETLADPLSDHPSLLTYAAAMADFVRGDEVAASAKFGQILDVADQLHVAGVNLPVPANLLQGTLIWKTLSWWQSVLLVLAILGLLGGLGFLSWLLFFKPSPLEVMEFRATGTSYIEGDPVKLSWTIRNPSQLKRIELKNQGPNPVAPVIFDFQQGKPPDGLKPRCDLSSEELKCNNILVSARAAGKYTFELIATSRSGNPLTPSKTEVEIAAKTDPKVTQFQPDGANYKVGEAVKLGWTIAEVGQLQTLNVVAKDKEGKATTIPVFQNNEVIAEFKDLCKQEIKTLTCANVPIAGLSSGQYNFSLQGTNTKRVAIAEFPSPTTVTLTALPMRLQAALNGDSSAIINVKKNEPLELTWQVEGGEGNLKVVVNPGGNSDQRSGSYSLGTIAQSASITITVTDESKPTPSTLSQTFAVNVITP